MKKRILTAALLVLALGGLCYAKKAKKADAGADVQQTESAAKPKKEKKAKKAKKEKAEKRQKEDVVVQKEQVAEEPAQKPAESAAAEEPAPADPAPAAVSEPASDSSSAPAVAPVPAQGQEKSAVSVHRVGGDVALQDGLVRIETARASGAVLFYVVNGKKFYPALKASEYGQSNYLSVFLGAKEYRLNKNGHCVYNYDVNSNSIKETLLVKDVVEVVALYQLGKYSPKDQATNCVRVTVTVKNLAAKKVPLALKAVYNLCLGENRQAHYSTAAKKGIGSEYVLVPSKEDGWIISSDGVNAVEFVLYGKGVTPPKKAAMANKDVIELATPITLFNPGNTFNSILSYNDSSLALFWDPVELDKDKSATYSYIVNFSDSDFQNSGKEIFEDPAKTQSEVGTTNVAADKTEQAAGGLDPSKLNMEYVQQLINHINSLQQGDASLNAAKIQQLQTEVDEVLQVLRSRK